MAKIDFYILEVTSGQKSLFFACQLIEKMYQAQQCVYVHCHSKEEAERLDALLWTYRDDSFVPHALYHAAHDYPPPVQLGFGNMAPVLPKEYLLLNMTQQIPPFHAQFDHMIEIVFSDPSVQQLARDRYKAYRDQGCELHTYKIKAGAI